MTRRISLVSALLVLLSFAALSSGQDRRGRRAPDRAPAVGSQAPNFELPRLVDGVVDPEQKVKLSSFRGKKPVALVFGSYT